MENIKAKLDLLELNERERGITEEKFLVPLFVANYEELKKIIDFLRTKNIKITKARELKVLNNEYSEIIKKFNIIESINELNLYREDPLRINANALDIYKKIKYCIQIGKPYKKEDGSYEKFLFSEAEWQKEFNRTSEVSLEASLNNTSSIEVKEPVNKEVDLQPTPTSKEVLNTTPLEEQPTISDFNPITPQEENDIDTVHFDELRKKLEDELKGLEEAQNEGLASNTFDDSALSEISWDEIGPDVYDTESHGLGVRR